jgi:hypothetical protein
MQPHPIEHPALPAWFDTSISPDVTSPVERGGILGTRLAMKFAVFYAMGMVLWTGLLMGIETIGDGAVSQSFDQTLHNIGVLYWRTGMTLLVLLLLALLISVPSAAIFGLMGGAIVGLFWLNRRRLSPQSFWVLGTLRSMARTVLFGLSVWGVFGWVNGLNLWLTVAMPTLMALFGFWRVAYQINATMYTPDSTEIIL